MTAVDVSEPEHIVPITDPLNIEMAKDAVADVALRARLGSSPHPVLLLPAFPSIAVSAYQILPAAVNLDTAEYIRQTGETGTTRQVPRVLLPLPVKDGAVDLSATRDPAHPADLPAHPVNQSILILVELHSTENAAAVLRGGDFDLLDAPHGTRTGTVPMQLAVDAIDLRGQPRLTIAAPLNWNDLAGLYPDTFEGVTPRLLRRGGGQHADLIQLLGQLVSLAHENQVSAYVPRLQPIVKWPLGQTAQADWDDFDSIAAPWLSGDGFLDRRPTDFWPVPEPDSLAGFDGASRAQYWRLAAEHFAQKKWLVHAMVVIHNNSSGSVPGGPSDAESTALSAEARRILLSDSRLRAMLPLRDDRTEFASDANPDAVPPTAASRLLAQSAGLIAPSPIRDCPVELKHWIDADPRDGLMSYVGVGNEQDIRTLAALAFLRDAAVIRCGSPLPTADVASGADQVIWFYPGQPYGVDHPLATLQLKWLAQAVQDYAWFHLGNRDEALKMCRLIARPVKLLPAQSAEPVYTLLAGSNDGHASDQARRLIIDAQSSPGRNLTESPAETESVDVRRIRWFSDHQHPTLVPSAVRWMWPDAFDQPDDQEPGRWVDAAVSIDIYNPADEMPNRNQLQWTQVPEGWEIHPQPIEIPSLAQFEVHRVVANARFNLDRIGPGSRQPLQLAYVDGFNGQATPFSFTLPVAVSERRQKRLSIDGSLGDWDAADALQLNQPLIRMLDRPQLQTHALASAATESSIYSSWSDENFYLAFRLGGVTTSDLRAVHNFVDYQSGRAWGEDLCEVLIQPVYADNVVGPTLHIVCKPGGEWIEQKSQPGVDGKWEPFEAAGVRYASGVDPAEKIWRGELAIPWQAIAAVNRSRPGLLRFNFIQHQHSTGQSASWAGPIDQGRDDSLSGLIFLREPAAGIGNTAER